MGATGRNSLLGHRVWGERRPGGVRQGLAVRKLDPATAAQEVQLRQQNLLLPTKHTLSYKLRNKPCCANTIYCYLSLKMLFTIYPKCYSDPVTGIMFRDWL